MMILHISKRRIAVMAVSFMVIAAVTVVLAGCFSDKENTITLADTAEMADYLQQLGWQVEPDPIETLDLQLPQTLGDTWGDYAAMQTEQGLPFADFAGQPIRRYTFRITNYPGMDGGVQANLYLCGDTLIGGDVVHGAIGPQRRLRVDHPIAGFNMLHAAADFTYHASGFGAQTARQ